MALWDPEIELELDEGEEILYQTHHHWVLLIEEEFFPFLIVLIAGGVATFRALGGGVFGIDQNQTQQLDWLSFLLIAALAILIVTWAREEDLKLKKKSKQKPAVDLTWILQVGILGVLALLWFRYQGGRVLVFNPDAAVPFDLFNLVLFGIAFAGLIWILYKALDWRDDTLVLTNTRIILDKEEFLVRHVQQQILLVDVQQVSMRQNTYPQVLFNYGIITIQSFSLKKITFHHTTRPKEMERRIKEELAKTTKLAEPNIVKRMIAERVFEEKKQAGEHAGAHKFHVETTGANRSGVFRWLFPPNPEIDEKSGQIMWRPSSIYVALQLLRPFTIWLGVTLVLAFTAPFISEWLWLAIVGWALVTLICGGWIFWLREELVNDVYILNKREIIDVDQKPFGPVDRRTAPIDRIQNISFDVTFLEQLLGFGTVKIQTGGSGDFTFNHVPDPRGVQAMVNDYLTDFKKSSAERNLQNSIDVFREYHALQREKGELMDRKAIDSAIDEKSQLAVSVYADQIAPIQIALTLRQALRAQVRAARRARVRKLIARHRISGDNTKES